MAFPSLSGSTPHTLEDAWSGLRSVATLVKSQAQSTLSAAQASGVDGNTLSKFCSFLADQLAFLNIYGTFLGAAQGGVAYAQAQVANGALDVVGTFNAMTTAITNTGAWIIANFPKDASNNLLFAQFTAQGRVQYTTFTPTQLAGLVTLLQALIATID